MDILVTGGAGFIGSHLCEALLSEGHHVVCLDDFSAGSAANLPPAANLEVVAGDVNDINTFNRLPRRNYGAVFHYAATVGVERTEHHPDNVLEDALGIENISKLARAGWFRKVIFASSSEVYGPAAQLPEHEALLAAGQTPYAWVKRYGELHMQTLWQVHGIPAVALRFFNVYGPRQVDTQADAFVVARFIRLVQDGYTPALMDGGRQTRDLVYVKDSVRAAIAALNRPEANGEVINVGTGREIAIAELAQEVIRQLGQEGIVSPRSVPGRTRDTSRRRASTDKMERLLGVKCGTRIKKGIQATLAHTAEKGSVQPWTKVTN